MPQFDAVCLTGYHEHLSQFINIHLILKNDSDAINQILEESMKTINLFWSFSLVMLGIGTIILAGSNLLSIELPDFMTRSIGLIDLASLPILGYTTVKKLKNKP